jgi:hypothetical protein
MPAWYQFDTSGEVPSSSITSTQHFAGYRAPRAGLMVANIEWFYDSLEPGAALAGPASSASS